MVESIIFGSCKTAIFHSKLYCSSERKAKIRAALENPVNAELVKQLDEYIGDQYKKPKTSESTNQTKKPASSDEEWGFDNESQSHAKPTIPHGGGGHPQRLSEKYGDALDAEGEAAFDATHPSESEDTDDTETQTVATSSTQVKKPYIAADSAIPMVFIENHVTLSGLAGEVKGTLNARASTQGVNRASVKNNELWIYYNDDVNLNNVMAAAIEVLNAANYQYLIFNRLARTDNAIVFDINCNDTLNAMEPVNNET